MKLNTQPAEKRVTGDGTVIVVNSIFHTIQGEGPFAGTPAVFVRLAGCNLQCPMCDTEYTERLPFSPESLLAAVAKAAPPYTNTNLVVMTGGEPFRQPIGPAVYKLLKTGGYRVQIETNGTLYQPNFPWWHEGLTVVCSPKTGAVHRELIPYISAFKYVGRAGNLDHDGLPRTALEHPAAPRLFRPPASWKGEVYLQPVDEQNHYPNKLNQDAVVDSCLKHGHRLCLQTHKIIGVA